MTGIITTSTSKKVRTGRQWLLYAAVAVPLVLVAVVALVLTAPQRQADKTARLEREKAADAKCSAANLGERRIGVVWSATDYGNCLVNLDPQDFQAP